VIKSNLGEIRMPIVSPIIPKVKNVIIPVEYKESDDDIKKKKEALLKQGWVIDVNSLKNIEVQRKTDASYIDVLKPKLIINFDNMVLPKVPKQKAVLNIEKNDVITQYMEYTDEDFILSFNDPLMEYKSRRHEYKNSFAWGQRKLGLVLIQFLTLYWDYARIKNPVVVYAGAAVGKNIHMSIDLFPEFEWHLYDPNFIDIRLDVIADRKVEKLSEPQKSIRKAEIIKDLSKKLNINTGDNGWFTNDTAKKFAGPEYKGRVFFLSDIRSVTHEISDEEFEKGVWRDMQMQSDWHKIINPVKSQLKFRLPYTTISEYDTKYIRYLKGTIYKQPYTKVSSTETRLVPDDQIGGIHPEIDYDFKLYESTMFYHNTIIRELHHFLNPLYTTPDAGIFTPVYPNELLNDYDSITETYIWVKYIKMRGQWKEMVQSNLEIIKKFVNIFTSYINVGNPHGKGLTLRRK
jgi:hypothetical protein